MCAFMGRLLSRRRQILSFGVCTVLMIAPCSAEPISSTPNPSAPAAATKARASSPALKPIDQVALQSMVAATAKQLLVPGAAVLLQTPQGEFAVNYGTTQLGRATPPRADTHFRIASNTKTMTAAVIMQLAQENKLSLGDAVSKYVSGVPYG